MNQFIIKVPENETFDELSDQVKEVVNHLRGQYASGLMAGTKAVDGYKLKLVMLNADLDFFKDFLTDGYPMFDDESGEEVIVDLGLDWEILASEGEPIKQDKILPFMLDKLEFDDEGEIVDYNPVTDLTGLLQTYSGRNWTY
tara:strand:- start:16660 stop:17085 length:426 start_codon:yes stop_codon:yes gene_type:complete